MRKKSELDSVFYQAVGEIVLTYSKAETVRPFALSRTWVLAPYFNACPYRTYKLELLLKEEGKLNRKIKDQKIGTFGRG